MLWNTREALSWAVITTLSCSVVVAMAQDQLVPRLQVLEESIRLTFDAQDGVVEERDVRRAVLAFLWKLAEALGDEHVGVLPWQRLARIRREALVGDPVNDLSFYAFGTCAASATVAR